MYLDDIMQRLARIPVGGDVTYLSDCLPHSRMAAHGLLVELKETLRSIDPLQLAARSKETATHFVWIIGKDAVTDARLCLHQFKNDSEASIGHANTIHNHRYDFVSLIMHGGYTEQVYDLDEATLDAGSVVSVPEPRERRVDVGDTTVVGKAFFHRVTDLAPNTLTLVAKSPSRTDKSISINVDSGVVNVHYSLHQRVQRLMVAIEKAAAILELGG